jgi:2-polyprenyl-3-methyl-5-hydroxy-6-metoxy-1,4-benzoquinol methylase
MDLSRRSYLKELLDRDDIPFVDIKRNMQELNLINTYLGGHSITLTGLKKILSLDYSKENAREILICEIGCGGGDNLRAVGTWCRKNNIDVFLIGIDINNECIQLAREMCKHYSAEFIHSDFKQAVLLKTPDIIFSSLFCHHFSNQELVEMMQWMKTNSKKGFFINDLHRHPAAYYSIKWLSKLFSKSYLVKHDAPLSVARGFKKHEWIALLHNAQITHYTIQWKWAFRWLIVVINTANKTNPLD